MKRGPKPHEGLTPREAEVMEWICKGKTYPEISQILGCAIGTAKNHGTAIREKLSVPNKAAAVAAWKDRNKS